ncbi:mechanosensitive ion channel family protein [Conyzicola sp.]|uniref:mechanosensitive ion channel family protein n=1 Tax=Conyzicola sp. TaxID=1969404 RepID=UPI00398A13BC
MRRISPAVTDPLDAVEGVLASATVSGWDVAVAIAIVLLGWIGSIFVKRATVALLSRWQGISTEVAALIARLVKYGVILLSVGIALSFLGASLQPLLTAAIIVAVVVFLALRGIADNFAAGVVLQTRRPVKVGDEIEVGSYVGSVRELNGRAVVIRTSDGRTVHVPNNQLLQSPVVNHSEAGARRSEIQIRVETGDDDRLEQLVPFFQNAAQEAEGVHKRESTRIHTIAVSPERVTFVVDFWHHPANTATVSSNVVEAVSRAARGAHMSATVRSDLPAAPVTPPDRF